MTPSTGFICLSSSLTIWPNSWLPIQFTSSSASSLSGDWLLTPNDASTQPGVSDWSTSAPGGGGTENTPMSRSGFWFWKNASSNEPPGYIAAFSLVNSVCAVA